MKRHLWSYVLLGAFTVLAFFGCTNNDDLVVDGLPTDVLEVQLTRNISTTADGVPVIANQVVSNPGQFYYLMVTGIDPNAEAMRFYINWGDNSALDSTDVTYYPSAKEVQYKHLYQNAGTYSIVVTAKTQASKTSANSQPLTVSVNTLKLADYTAFINSFVNINAPANGTYTVGNATSGDSDEYPTFPATISSFAMSKYEVPQNVFTDVMKLIDPEFTNPSLYQGDANRPAENVTWYEAIRFCNKLSEKKYNSPLENYYGISGDSAVYTAITRNPNAKGYRLPTEAEWEYAANANSGTIYPGGNEVDPISWFVQNSFVPVPVGDQPIYITHAVGEKAPNAFNLFDMAGNVSEWCDNWYTPYPLTDAVGSHKAIRGGNCMEGAHDLRITNRTSGKPGFDVCTVGFRVVKNKLD